MEHFFKIFSSLLYTCSSECTRHTKVHYIEMLVTRTLLHSLLHYMYGVQWNIPVRIDSIASHFLYAITLVVNSEMNEHVLTVEQYKSKVVLAYPVLTSMSCFTNCTLVTSWNILVIKCMYIHKYVPMHVCNITILHALCSILVNISMTSTMYIHACCNLTMRINAWLVFPEVACLIAWLVTTGLKLSLVLVLGRH